MFPTLSLLNHVECPDHRTGSCHRPSCPFLHASTRRQKDEEEEDAGAESSGRGSASGSSQGLKRKASAESYQQVGTKSDNRPANHELQGLLSALKAGPKNAFSAKKQLQQQQQQSKTEERSTSYSTVAAAAASVTSHPSLGMKAVSQPVKNPVTDRPSPPSSHSSTVIPTRASATSTALQAPSIARTTHPGTSPVPYTSRQSSLQTLFTTFHSLYCALVPRTEFESSGSSPLTEADRRVAQVLQRAAHFLACQHSLSSEAKIFKNSNVNFLAYRNSVRTSLVSLHKRQKVEREAQEKKEQECIATLGVEAGAVAIKIDRNMSKSALEDGERLQTMEDTVIELVSRSPLIGTSDEVETKKRAREARLKGTLDRARMESANLLATEEVLRSVGYPLPGNVELDEQGQGDSIQASILKKWGEGGLQHTCEGSTMDCNRCGTPFVVQPLDSISDEEKEACSYHWGKRRFVRDANVAKGPRLPRWTCCDALDESATFASDSLSQIASSAGFAGATDGQASPQRGCARGPHVFKEEEDALLHQREGYLTTARVSEQLGLPMSSDKRGKHDVLAFDCELVYTTAGMSLARLTVIDESGAVILDQFVRPRAPILDYNTRFSGIKETDLKESKNVADLASARQKMVALMGPSTILVGHGLENDLKAVRLVHSHIADSALLYPHHKGLPFRYGLRDLTLKHLGRHIQGGDATVGHDAEEDARAALELVRSKYIEFIEGRQSSSLSASMPVSTSRADGFATDPNADIPIPGNKSAEAVTKPSHNGPPRPIPSAPALGRAESHVSGPSAAATASLFIKKPKKRKP